MILSIVFLGVEGTRRNVKGPAQGIAAFLFNGAHRPKLQALSRKGSADNRKGF